MAAPVLAGAIADWAICCGVTGTAGFRPGVSAEPVTAHEIMTLRCMRSSSQTFESSQPRVGRHRRNGTSRPPHRRSHPWALDVPRLLYGMEPRSGATPRLATPGGLG